MGQIKRGISLARDLRRVGIAERGLVLDVGAHFGESIRFFRRVRRPSQVHAFEPIENSVRRLRRRWRLSNSVVLNQVAVSDLDSEVLFIGSGGGD